MFRAGRLRGVRSMLTASDSRRVRTRRAKCGFTLIELAATLALIAILAALAYPSVQSQVRQARRSDAMAALARLQGAEERWRSTHLRYATLEELGVPPISDSRLYVLQVVAADEVSYELLAVAQGSQARDESCRYLKLASTGATIWQASGPDADAGNSAAANRRCWAR